MPRLNVAIYENGKRVGLIQGRAVRETPGGSAGVLYASKVFPLYASPDGQPYIELSDPTWPRDTDACPFARGQPKFAVPSGACAVSHAPRGTEGLGAEHESADLVNPPVRTTLGSVRLRRLGSILDAPLLSITENMPVSVRLTHALQSAAAELQPIPTIRDLLDETGSLWRVLRRTKNFGRVSQNELSLLVDSLRSGNGVQVMSAEAVKSRLENLPLWAPPEHPSDARPEEILASVIGKLAPRLRRVIERRRGVSGPEETLDQIGLSEGVTRERIRQLEVKAMSLLSSPENVARLREAIRQHKHMLANQLLGAAGALLLEDSERAFRALEPLTRFSFEIVFSSPSAWLSREFIATDVGWFIDQRRVDLFARVGDSLQQISESRALPRPINGHIDNEEIRILPLAARQRGLGIYGSYLCRGRIGVRARRTVRLHALLSQSPHAMAAIGDLLADYRDQNPDDPCSIRDALIVMADAPHLFLALGEEHWSAINALKQTLTRALPGPSRAHSTFDEDNNSDTTGPTRAAEATVTAAVVRAIESLGPARFTDIRRYALKELGDDSHAKSIGPTLLLAGRFRRIAPGVYALREQVDAVVRGEIEPSALFSPEQCRFFTVARHAGCDFGVFPAWTAAYEWRLCRWAETTIVDRALFESLLAVAEPSRWAVETQERDYWTASKIRRARYHLLVGLPRSISAPIYPDRLLAAAKTVCAEGGINWIKANMVLGKRIDSDTGASLLALLVKTGVVNPPKHWQDFHPRAEGAEKVVRVLDERIGVGGHVDNSALTELLGLGTDPLGRASSWLDAFSEHSSGSLAASMTDNEDEELSLLESGIASLMHTSSH